MEQPRVISRDSARASNLQRYFTGKPCKHGHHAERYVINKVCVTCQHIERTSARASKYNAEYRRNNLEAIADKDYAHKAINEASYRANTKSVIPSWANRAEILRIYEKARSMRKETGVYWTVDHIVPLKSRIVCGLHCDANLQIIGRSENSKKHNSWWPDMP